MADADERALLRAWRTTGAVADGEAYLLARLRNGLPRERLELAALVGEPAAAGALAGGPRAALPRDRRRPPLRAEEALAWLVRRVEADDWPGGLDCPQVEAARQLAAWAETLVPGAALRASLAALRLAVERTGGAGTPSAALDAAEAFVACPCGPHAARLVDAEAALASPPRGAPDRGGPAWSAAGQAVAAVVEGGRARSHHDAGRVLCLALGRDRDLARSVAVRQAAFRAEADAVAAALLPWALGEDPLAARHPPLEGAPQVPVDPPPRDAGACEVAERPVEWAEDPFGPPLTPALEVRRAGVVWTGATQHLTAALRRLRFLVLAGRPGPVTTTLNGAELPVPLPPGAPPAQLAALEEAIAAHEAWRRARWP